MSCDYNAIFQILIIKKKIPDFMVYEFREFLTDHLWAYDNGCRTQEELYLVANSAYEDRIIDALAKNLCGFSVYGYDSESNVQDLIDCKNALSHLLPLHIDILWMHVSGYRSEEIGHRYGAGVDWAQAAVFEAFYDFRRIMEGAA